MIMKILTSALIIATASSSSVFADVSDDIMRTITTPDKVETSIGTLNFSDGVPSHETVSNVYDYLDTMRAVDTFLKGISLASHDGLFRGNLDQLGAKEVHQIPITSQLLDSKPLYLTGNTSTLYASPMLDLLRDGPTVIELPPGLLGAANDAAFHYVADLGPLGADRGKGGKYLFLPPGYEGEVPEGYFVVNTKSYRHWVFLRASIANGLDAANAHVRNNLKVYPLSKVDNPPEMEFVDGSNKSFNTVHANTIEFYYHLNEVIQREPLELIDAETRGLFASIGIEKGKSFNPDARMKKILTDAVAIGNAAARSIVWYPRTDGYMEGAQVFPADDSAWVYAYLDKNVFFNGKDQHTKNHDAQVMFHYPYAGVTPAMAISIPGVGSDYGIAFVDDNKEGFDGGQTYRLRVPANVPAKDFWAVTIYDSQTRSLLQTSQKFPTVDSIGDNVKRNADGSYDIYFGPKAPKGFENNWLETLPGKSWFTIFRIYGPLEAWIEKEWRLNDIKLVK